MQRPPVRVLVADDSAFMRHVISSRLDADPDIQVVGQARDGQDAVRQAAELRPDVITLDIEMPRMDGLTALRHIMADSPVPVLMVSTLTQSGASVTIRALEMGAADVLAKPSGSISVDFDRVAPELVRKVKRLARTVRIAQLAKRGGRLAPPAPPPAAHAPRRRPPGRVELCVIGASTGGPKALTELIPALPPDLPVPVVVVQHMPPRFTASLAERLDELSELTVQEAADGVPLRRGSVCVAPGGIHLVIGPGRRLHTTDDPPVHGVRPSIDVFLNSVPSRMRAQTVVSILTGMGSDGADGAESIAEAGGYVIAEDESSCVVYGMPRAVVERGIDAEVAPLQRMAEAITAATGRVGQHV